jgi:hypothetical protein
MIIRPRAASAAIFAAVVAFVALIVPAMAEYPGGTGWDPTSHGNDFWLNYLCDLERTVAIDGRPNAVGSVLAQAAILLLASGMLPFWWVLPRRFPRSARLGRAARALGLAALPGIVAVALLPSDRFASCHPFTMLFAGLPGLAAAACAALGLAREERLDGAVAGLAWATVLTSSLDFVLYLRQLASTGPGPTALSILERASLLMVLAWMCAVAWRMRQPRVTVQRAAHPRAVGCTPGVDPAGMAWPSLQCHPNR